MKQYFFVLLTVTTFLGYSQQKKVTNTSEELLKKEVNLFLNNWHKAASEADFDTYFNAMATESIYIGTDASENWSKEQFKAYSKPHFDKGKAWSFNALERNVYTNTDQNFVWFDELLNTQMGACKGSGVLIKKGNTWQIKHYVLSVAIPNADMGKVIKVKQNNDALFLEKYKN